jgi:type IV pilus assembly protein PilM
LTITRTAKPSTVVGLEIEAGSVAATEVHVNGRAEVVGHGIMELEPGLFSEGEVADVDHLADALRELVTTNKLGKDVRLGVANQRVVVRLLHLPLIEDPKELDTAVRFQAQEQLPMPSDEATIDWQLIPPPMADPAAADGMDVVAVAARTDMVGRATEAMRKAGLRPIGIDHSAFGMIRAFGHAQPDAQQPVAGGAVLHCSLGDLTNLAVAHGSSCLFTRAANFGVEAMAQQLAERATLSLGHARELLITVGLAEDGATVMGDGQTNQLAREVLVAGVARLADELRISLDYYATQEGAIPVGSVLVSGIGSAIPGLVPTLESALGRALVVARPAELGQFDDQVAARLTVPFGLALDS